MDLSGEVEIRDAAVFLQESQNSAIDVIHEGCSEEYDFLRVLINHI